MSYQYENIRVPTSIDIPKLSRAGKIQLIMDYFIYGVMYICDCNGLSQRVNPKDIRISTDKKGKPVSYVHLKQNK